jgi:uncharacterized C2H2 Zn-finger protein
MSSQDSAPDPSSSRALFLHKSHFCLVGSDENAKGALCPVCLDPLRDGHYAEHLPPTLQCPICDKLFHTRWRLNAHLKQGHAAAKARGYKPPI